MVSTTHKNGDFGDGLWNCFNHINYFYVPFSIATRSKLPEGSRCGKANDMERSSYCSKDGTPVAVPTGAIKLWGAWNQRPGRPRWREEFFAGWFQTWILFSISYMGCHPSHWRTHIFQRGRYTTTPTSLWIPWWISHDFTIQGGKWRFLTTNI